tara:strand:- start:55 stop:345 length:291 start_codon:yes stop_codon:yes gene_type:complete
MNSQNQWGKIIRDLRRERRLSIEKLAALSKVSKNTIGSLELNGQKRNCSVGILERVLAILGHELDAIPIEEDFKPMKFVSATYFHSKVGGMNDEHI